MADVLRCPPFVWRLASLRRVVLVLLSALVLMQTVGVLHRVAHTHNSLHSAAVSEGVATSATPGLFSSLQRLWGEHGNALDCQLFDHSCPEALHTPFVVLMPVLPVPGWVLLTLHERFALFERFYAARGPPVWH